MSERCHLNYISIVKKWSLLVKLIPRETDGDCLVDLEKATQGRIGLHQRQQL